MQQNYRYNKLLESVKFFGKPSLQRVRSMLVESPEKFSPEDFSFLENYLSDDTQEELKISILQVLCRFGNRVDQYLPRFNKISSRFGSEIIKIAEKQNDPDTIISIVSENNANVNLAIIALKRLKKIEYLTSFLFSGNEDLVNTIQDLEKNNVL